MLANPLAKRYRKGPPLRIVLLRILGNGRICSAHSRGMGYDRNRAKQSAKGAPCLLSLILPFPFELPFTFSGAASVRWRSIRLRMGLAACILQGQTAPTTPNAIARRFPHLGSTPAEPVLATTGYARRPEGLPDSVAGPGRERAEDAEETPSRRNAIGMGPLAAEREPRSECPPLPPPPSKKATHQSKLHSPWEGTHWVWSLGPQRYGSGCSRIGQDLPPSTEQPKRTPPPSEPLTIQKPETSPRVHP